MMKFISNSVDDLRSIAKSILDNTTSKVFAMYGPMGAGKTTITKAFCECLNVIDVVNSPTFAIINEYITDKDESVYHFDCYRLKSISEFMDIGGEDYIYSNNYCFIEWAEIIENLLPNDCNRLYIKPDNTGKNRIITLNDTLL